jgi:hypothetical protein
MVMDPRTHPRGAPPDFALPKPNPNPGRMTDALWWLVCMREALEPARSDNGGTYTNKPGYHNAGKNLPDHGPGHPRTDHSIRRPPDRSGPWWKQYGSAHDWTFRDAQAGNYTTIDKYTTRLVNAMRDPADLRPDDVYAYTLGQMDNDPVVEGHNEYTDMAETSADKSHNWHRHDSFRRNIIGQFPAMWKALTIDMGWTYAEWLRSVKGKDTDMPLTTADAVTVWTHDLRNGEGVDEAYKVLNRAAADAAATRAAVATLTAQIAALAGRDLVDEAAIAAAVIAGLNPDQLAQVIADAMPAELAQQTADLVAATLAARLAD